MSTITLHFDLPARFLDDRGERTGFVLLAAFLLSFLFIRTSARLIRSPRVPWWPGSVTTGGGLHLHHLVWGIVLLLATGFLGFALSPRSPFLRLAFGYRGSLFYFMKAGMGDTVFTPFYEVLKRRRVKFRFFHSVTDLRLSPDGDLIDEIDVVPQVKLPRAAYQPLVSVEGLRCWPSEPIWSRLQDGEQLKKRGIDFELDSNPLKRKPVTLVRDKDFSAVVLAIPVGALGQICSQIAERHDRFAKMIDSAETVRTPRRAGLSVLLRP